jgi:hypothetical protein
MTGLTINATAGQLYRILRLTQDVVYTCETIT